jgi:membrane protease YdiL (CAAX protease family)
MSTDGNSYWSATKHPWACVLFVLPLLATYEIGLYALGHTAPEDCRNGADAWLRAALSDFGISPVYGAPCLLVFVLLLWGLLCREDRPTDKIGVWVGMTGESAAYALLLLGLSQGFWLVLLRADHVFGQPSHRIALLQLSSQSAAEPMWGQIVSYLGAGIYEETLFRLMLYAGLLRLFSWSEARASLLAVALAAFGSALLFAGAHHVGPNGEPFNAYVLSFRTFAGLYFAWLYHARGFGIAVGAHAGYDVLVGLILQRV